MAMRMTDRNGQGGESGAQGLTADYLPSSHVLAKVPGDRIDTGWGVTNSRSQAAQVLMRLRSQTMGAIIATTTAITAPGGGARTPLALALAGLTEGQSVRAGANSMMLELYELVAPQEVLIAFHTFTVNFTVALAPLVADPAAPTIT